MRSMAKPTLYLMLGYPGAGKTTVSRYIHELTGAVHLWADRIRHERFTNPTHSHQENIELYDYLNEVAAELIASDQSVIFDTNFNFYKDREKLRKIANEHGADAWVIWVKTPKELAKKRATNGAHLSDTRVLGDMPAERFDKISGKLEPPGPSEKTISLTGKGITKEIVRKALEKTN